MSAKKDVKDLKNFLNEHIVAVNIVELIQYYEGRIHELEHQLREAQRDNAENLFRNSSNI